MLLHVIHAESADARLSVVADDALGPGREPGSRLAPLGRLGIRAIGGSLALASLAITGLTATLSYAMLVVMIAVTLSLAAWFWPRTPTAA